jgi:hypothetical protein
VVDLTGFVWGKHDHLQTKVFNLAARIKLGMSEFGSDTEMCKRALQREIMEDKRVGAIEGDTSSVEKIVADFNELKSNPNQ